MLLLVPSESVITDPLSVSVRRRRCCRCCARWSIYPRAQDETAHRWRPGLTRMPTRGAAVVFDASRRFSGAGDVEHGAMLFPASTAQHSSRSGMRKIVSVVLLPSLLTDAAVIRMVANNL